MRVLLLTGCALVLAGSGLSGCETISEEACLAGSWEDIGFKDGEAGRSRSRLADIAETCAEFGVTPDRQTYFSGYELGLDRYCGPRTGYDAGRQGLDPHNECELGGYADYMDAYSDGYVVYQIERDRDALVSRWNDRRDAFLNVSERLLADDLPAKERRRLEKKAARLSNQMDDLRIDIRAMEQLHDLPRWTPPTD